MISHIWYIWLNSCFIDVSWRCNDGPLLGLHVRGPQSHLRLVDVDHWPANKCHVYITNYIYYTLYQLYNLYHGCNVYIYIYIIYIADITWYHYIMGYDGSSWEYVTPEFIGLEKCLSFPLVTSCWPLPFLRGAWPIFRHSHIPLKYPLIYRYSHYIHGHIP